MTLQLTKLALATGLLLSISLTAFATDAIVGTGRYARLLCLMKMMNIMDADGNHEVALEDFLTYHENVFSLQDKSVSGQIDAQE